MKKLHLYHRLAAVDGFSIYCSSRIIIKMKFAVDGMRLQPVLTTATDNGCTVDDEKREERKMQLHIECKHFISFRVPLSQRINKSFLFFLVRTGPTARQIYITAEKTGHNSYLSVMVILCWTSYSRGKCLWATSAAINTKFSSEMATTNEKKKKKNLKTKKRKKHTRSRNDCVFYGTILMMGRSLHLNLNTYLGLSSFHFDRARPNVRFTKTYKLIEAIKRCGPHHQFRILF